MNTADEATLAADFLASAGRPVVTIKEAADLSGTSPTTIRRGLWRGELSGSRAAANGPIRIRLRELARWIVAGEKRSLPVNKALLKRAAKAEGAGT